MMPQSLDQLSEREKTVLRLLAQGHTVKSAAAMTGDSDHAANELLRSARRKLGVASSREAARRLAQAEGAPRKNRDEKIGIAAAIAARFRPVHLATGGLMLTAIIALPLLLAGTAQDEADMASSAHFQAPHVVSTYPAHGATIAPGPFELKVTFDRPMLSQWSIWSPEAINDEHIACVGNGPPTQSEDRRSFTLSCEAKAGAQHTVAFGHESKGFFKGEDWTDAAPFVLSFTVARKRADLGLSDANAL